MSDTPETQEAVERWRQGKINIFDEMARLETERNNLEDQRDFCMSEIERLRKECDEARDTARWLYQHGMATLIEGASGNEWIKEQIK